MIFWTLLDHLLRSVCPLAWTTNDHLPTTSCPRSYWMTPWRKPELWLIVCGKHTPGPLESRGLIEKGSKFQFLLACWCPIVVLKAMFPLLYVSFIPRGRSCIVCGTVMGEWMLLWSFFKLFELMSGSSHIRSVLIGVEYRNYHQTLDVYLLFAVLLGQIK